MLILALPPDVPILASLVPLNILLALSPVTVLALPYRYAPVMLPLTLKLVPVAAPMFGVVKVGDVANTTSPVPVYVEKSVIPDSQSAAVVNEVPIQVHIAVVPGITVITAFNPDD